MRLSDQRGSRRRFWTVWPVQTWSAALLLPAVAISVAAAACGSSPSRTGPAERVAAAGAVTAAAPEDADDPSTVAAAPEAGGGADDGSFVMPNEIGKRLPDARAHLRRASGNPRFESFAADALGRGQILFENVWKVCDQTIPAGVRAEKDATILFAAVKRTEDCP